MFIKLITATRSGGRNVLLGLYKHNIYRSRYK